MFTLYFFFFQAEDGIRDYKVTGVQTCALPIYPRHQRARHHHLRDRAECEHGAFDRPSRLRASDGRSRPRRLRAGAAREPAHPEGLSGRRLTSVARTPSPRAQCTRAAFTGLHGLDRARYAFAVAPASGRGRARGRVARTLLDLGRFWSLALSGPRARGPSEVTKTSVVTPGGSAGGWTDHLQIGAVSEAGF